MDLPDSDQGAHWFSQAGLKAIHATTKLMQPMPWKCPATSGPGFAVPQLPAPLLSAVCWPGPAVTWLCRDLAGAESQQETNPRRQGELLRAGSAPVLEGLGLIWTPAPWRKEDMSNSWGWRWGGGPLILAKVWLRCDVRLCSKATWAHPYHLLISEGDLAIMGKTFKAHSSRKVENNWNRWYCPLLSSPTWCASVVMTEKHQPIEGWWEQRQQHVMLVSHQIWKCLAPAVGNGTKYDLFQSPLTGVLWTALAQLTGFLRGVSEKLCFILLFLCFDGVCIPYVMKKYAF